LLCCKEKKKIGTLGRISILFARLHFCLLPEILKGQVGFSDVSGQVSLFKERYPLHYPGYDDAHSLHIPLSMLLCFSVGLQKREIFTNWRDASDKIDIERHQISFIHMY
jgi:hypothetical protein